MRELKFRVWDKLAERFTACDEGYQAHYVLSLKGEFHNLQNGSGGKEYVVQQYTGRKDKNGKEVYEGDCIKNSDGLVLSVKWNQKRCCFAASRSTEDGWLDLLEDLMDDFEVIGNIFENSELLKP